MTNAHEYAAQHEILDDFVRGSQARFTEEALSTYYNNHNGDVRAGYRGRLFDEWGGSRGDAADIQNDITSTDILSLTSLSIERDLGDICVTVENNRTKIQGLLADIPTTPLHEVGQDVILPGSAASELWHTIRNNDGAGRRPAVAAYKLTARKRPDLLPVYDRVVERYLFGTKPQDIWQCLWTYLNDDPTRVDAIRERREAAGISQSPTELRCLDVALWMKAR